MALRSSSPLLSEKFDRSAQVMLVKSNHSPSLERAYVLQTRTVLVELAISGLVVLKNDKVC